MRLVLFQLLAFAFAIQQARSKGDPVDQVVLTNKEDQAASSAPIRVAVIGAGAAGSSAAYHLAQYAADANLSLKSTIFERNSYVGGRTTTINVYSDGETLAELGGSIFVQVNQILVKAVETFNLTTSALGEQARARSPAPALGIWNGEQFVLTLSPSGATWWDTAKLLWKYGLAPVRTKSLMKTIVGRFLQMYEKPHFPFQSLTQTAESVELLEVTSVTGAKLLAMNAIAAPFAADVIQASTRVNYAQNLDFIHGLEVMVCMATEGAMAVDGGNWQIFDNMIEASGAEIRLATQVSSVRDGKDGAFDIESRSLVTEDSVLSKSEFDAVIIAAPFHQTNILTELADFRTPENVSYVALHVTIFTSPHLLSPRVFRLEDDQAVPLTVLTTLRPDEVPQTGSDAAGDVGFFSISTLDILVNPQTGAQEFLYKIFSPDRVGTKELLHLVGVDENDETVFDEHITWITRKLWHSYPYEIPRRVFDDAQLGENLWYTGGMDAFISTMETNALMGKNVARLLVDRFTSSAED